MLSLKTIKNVLKCPEILIFKFTLFMNNTQNNSVQDTLNHPISSSNIQILTEQNS